MQKRKLSLQKRLKNNDRITAPKKNAGGSISICKYCPFGKEIYFALQMSKKQLALLLAFR